MSIWRFMFLWQSPFWPVNFSADCHQSPKQLAALENGLMGLFIKVHDFKATSVPNVFACGDAARAAGNVTLAVADGAMAGFGAHRASMV
jgi:thioredoxin reductase